MPHRAGAACQKESPTVKKPHILVIDDEAHVRESVRMVLKMSACNVSEAASGIEGIEGIVEAGRQRPDLIFCNLNMPGLDGLQTIRALRRNPHLAGIPVVIMSGTPQDPCPPGVSSCLLKPFSVSDLLDLVRRYAGNGCPESSRP